MELFGHLVDRPGEVCVLDEEGVDVLVVAVGLRLLDTSWRFWPIMTNVERKIASSETASVSVGHGLL